MKIAETYSHLNGLEFLLIHKPNLWQEIQDVTAAVDANEYRAETSKEKTTKGKLLFSPTDMNAAFDRLLREKSWRESRVNYWIAKNERLMHKTLSLPAEEQKREIEAAGETAIFSHNQADFVKERVAVEVQFGKYVFVVYDIFVKLLAFYVSNQIDVGIEILPTKSLQNQMISRVACYEEEFYNVVRQGRGIPAMPFVLVGIEP